MREETRFWLIAATFAAVGAFAVATVALFVAVASGPSEAAVDSSDQQGAVAPIDVALGEFFVRPAALTASNRTAVTLHVRNTGGIEHDLSLGAAKKTARLASGSSETLSLGTMEVGTYQLVCSVPGHADLGMTATLTISEEHRETLDPASQSTAMSPQKMDEEYLARVKAFPAHTAGLGNQLTAPVLDGQVKVFDLTAEEIDWETEPGLIKKAMAYNRQVPGPQIRVRLGDRVRVVLHNKMTESTAIHFHGLVVPNSEDGVPGITQPLVLPGESYTYEFTVRNSGTHMYHSHMNGAHQIPAGLLGAFIVEGEREPTVDLDTVMVLDDGPLGYTINGKGFPATTPIVAKPGQKIRIRYMNEGLQIHPMHLHGMPQLVIAKDGWTLPTPHFEDTVLVAPGERIDVIVEASEIGTWAFHCHVLTHAEGPNGMFGMVTALVVEE